MKKNKVISIEEFFKRSGQNPVTMGAGIGSYKSNSFLNLYSQTPYSCGCGKTHRYVSDSDIASDITRMWWYSSGLNKEMILQHQGCTFLNYIKMEGAFKVTFNTLYSANVLKIKRDSEYRPPRHEKPSKSKDLSPKEVDKIISEGKRRDRLLKIESEKRSKQAARRRKTKKKKKTKKGKR